MGVFRPPQIVRHYSWGRWWKGLDVQPNIILTTLTQVRITEAASATETQSAVGTFPASITEAAAATDTPSAVATYPASITEAAAATDTPSAVGLYPASVTETATATDAPSAVGTYPGSVTEAATATETQSVQTAFAANAEEAAAALDTSDATQDITNRPGSGKRIDPLRGPTPDYDAKPAKRYQPIWDKLRAEKIAARNAELARRRNGPVPLPPADPNFGRQASAAPAAPPSFAHLVPPDPMGIERRLRDARDMTDIADVSSAMAMLASLGLVTPSPQ